MDGAAYLSFSLDFVAVAICSVAAWVDLKTYQIPNALPVIGLLWGVIAHAAIGLLLTGGGTGVWQGLLSAFVGMLLMAMVFGLMVAIAFVGMGDLKLMAALGALVGWPQATWALAHVTIAGGVVAIAFALARGQLARVVKNLWGLSQRTIGRRPEVALHRIPYGVAIWLGALWTVLAKYFPALRLPS